MNRRARLIFAAGLTLITSLLLDRPVAALFEVHPPDATIRSIARVMQWPGHFGFTLAVVAVILVLEKRPAIHVVFSMLASATAAGLLTVVIKWIVGRTRPLKGIDAFDLHPFVVPLGGPNLSFPSGHTALAFATAACAFALGSKVRGVLFAWAVCTAVARCVLSAHYPSDVVAAAFVGGLCGIACTYGCRRLLRVAETRSPRAGDRLQ